jgi:hypothetical protein
MATTVKQEAFLATLEYFLDGERKRYIYPMKLRHLGEVQELFALFNDDIIILNFPSPLLDEHDKPVLSESGEEIIDTTAYDAMLSVLELALNDTKENIESYINIGQIEEVLAKYRRISGLLEKKKMMEQEILSGLPSLQV